MASAHHEVQAYLEALPNDARKTLESLRRLIRRIAPDAVEGFSYRMPAFKYRGRPLVYVGAAKDHCALYGMSEVIASHQVDLAAYDTSKGAIRFPAAKPPPRALVEKLVRARMASIDAAASAPKRAPRAARRP